MLRYKTPEVGSVVTVTTQYRNLYLYSDAAYDRHTYRDVEVLPAYDWMKREEFRVKDVRVMGDGHIEMDRVINVCHLAEMIGDGVELTEVDDALAGTHYIDVKSNSSSKVYNVTVEDGVGTECNCKGFGFRRRCSHLAGAIKMLKAQK